MNYTVMGDKIIAPLEHRDTEGRYNLPLAQSIAYKGPVITITSSKGGSLFHYITDQPTSPSVQFNIGSRAPDHEEIADRINQTQEWFSKEMLRVRKLSEDLATLRDYDKRRGATE